MYKVFRCGSIKCKTEVWVRLEAYTVQLMERLGQVPCCPYCGDPMDFKYSQEVGQDEIKR